MQFLEYSTRLECIQHSLDNRLVIKHRETVVLKEEKEIIAFEQPQAKESQSSSSGPF
jgi:hypothetical protein